MSEEAEVIDQEQPPLEIQNMIQHAMDQEYSQANNIFGDIMTMKLNDMLDQEKIRLADQIYNGGEDDEDIDPDEDQLELDLEGEGESESEEQDDEEDVEVEDNEDDDDDDITDEELDDMIDNLSDEEYEELRREAEEDEENSSQ